MKNKPLLAIFFVVFLDLLGFGIVIPILPYYANSYGASGLTLGMLMMCYSLMQFLFSPFWGRVSDKMGRRPVILTCVLGMGGAMVLLGFANNLVLLFVARLLAGFFGANLSAASAFIADNTTLENRTKGMGMIGAAFGLGFLFGPALGGILSTWGYGTVGFVAAGLAFLNFIFAWFILHDAPLTEIERAKRRTHLNLDVLKQVFANNKTAIPILLFFLVTFSMAHIETTFGLYLLKRFNLDAYHAGLILALSAFIMASVQGGGIGKLSKRLGEKKLIVGGSVLMTLALVGVAFSVTVPLFILFMVVHTLGYSVTNPSLSSTTSKNTPSHLQGLSLGVYHAGGSLGRILGPLAAGFVFDQLGIHVPFLVASGVVVVVFVVGFFKLE
ncbi:MAG: multidrug resistance protein [uncultured bacterium]|nr:MAG: multidrug resistance protein [uncultured bacterium]